MTADKDALLREIYEHIKWRDVPQELLSRITAALAEKDGGGLKMHDPEGQRRCGFSSDDDAMDEGDSSWCIDPDMGAR